MNSKKRRYVFILFLMVATVLACILLAEGGLRYYRWKLVNANLKRSRAISGDAKIIISLGESTAYGLWADPDMNYSALLEKALNQLQPDDQYKVLNLGFNGAISDDIIECFMDATKFHQPAAVLVCMGNNDFSYMLNYRKLGLKKKSTHPFMLQENMIGVRFDRGLLLWKVIRELICQPERTEEWVIVEDRQGNRYVNYYRPADREKQFDATMVQEIVEGLKNNYKILDDHCRNWGSPLLIVGYINGDHPNHLAIEMSRELNVAYVDNAVADEERKKELTFHDVFHPNERGHHFIAENIVGKLKETGFLTQF